MRYILLAALSIALPTLVPSIALAETADVQKMKTDDCARARKANKTCVLDIGEENIEGSVGTATGTVINPRQFAVLNSLVHIRKDFIPEILKTAENID
ncbi:MAG TPA: hypothetical protein VL326_28255 [Kofleriaceae bacterium]|nr:hypothetical protein [Kofleriaceae bacterium]